MLLHRLLLPAAALGFFGLAVVVPALRVRRRTGVWPIVVGASGAPYQRLLAWLMRAFAVAYPRHVPTSARKVDAPDGTATYEISFTAPTTTVVYREDGTFVNER